MLNWRMMRNLDMATVFGAKVAALMDGRVCPLGGGKPNRAAFDQLRSLTPADLSPGRAIVDDDMARCCLAGLWLLHDFLDESHQISQEIDTPTGSYWHGIMHRREGDFDNAKYWFRRVGRHEVFGQLSEAAREVASVSTASVAASLSGGAWDPYRFVDQCQTSREGTADETLVRQIAQREWELLFAYCHGRAVS